MTAAENDKSTTNISNTTTAITTPLYTEFIKLLLPSATFWVCLGQASSSCSLAHTASIGLLWQIANAHVLCHVTSEAAPL